METREHEQQQIDAGETLRNPLLAFIGRHYYAPPAPGQSSSVAWQADAEGHDLWLPRLAETLNRDVSVVRAVLYDVTCISPSVRDGILKAVVGGAINLSSGAAAALHAQYDDYCAAAVWARFRADRRMVVVDGVTLYDACVLSVMLGRFSWTGWKYRLMDARLATTSWDQRLYTTEEALRCWLSGDPCPAVPSLRAAVRAAGCSGKLPPGEVSKLKATWGQTWVEFQGERYIWGKEVAELYRISARALRRARHEGRLQSGIIGGMVLVPFESLQSFLKWWYARDCTWRRTAADRDGGSR